MDELISDNNNISGENNCAFNFFANATCLYFVKPAFSCLGILMCFVAAVILFSKCGLLIYKIVFYTVLANGVHAIVQLADIFPVYPKGSALILRNGSNWFYSLCDFRISKPSYS